MNQKEDIENYSPDDLHTLCSSYTVMVIKLRQLICVGHVKREKINAYEILRGKPEQKRPLGRTGRRR
jgi:hypothetical protein